MNQRSCRSGVSAQSCAQRRECATHHVAHALHIVGALGAGGKELRVLAPAGERASAAAPCASAYNLLTTTGTQSARQARGCRDRVSALHSTDKGSAPHGAAAHCRTHMNDGAVMELRSPETEAMDLRNCKVDEREHGPERGDTSRRGRSDGSGMRRSVQHGLSCRNERPDAIPDEHRSAACAASAAHLQAAAIARACLTTPAARPSRSARLAAARTDGPRTWPQPWRWSAGTASRLPSLSDMAAAACEEV
jgi:hypothetical protein